MADRTLYTNECALNEAADIQTALAASKLRLGDTSFVPTVVTTQAELVAGETGLVGYPAGGYALATWGDPQLAPGGGAVTTSPSVAVNYASGAAAPIGYWWIEDAGGDVRAVGVFDPPRVLATVGDGFTWIRQLLYGRNTV